MPRPLTFLFIFGLLIGALRAAEQPSAAETKLREGLRNTMLQLRNIQAERDTLQAEKTTLESEKVDLTGKFEALTKQAAANQDSAQKNIATLEAKVSVHETEIAQLKEALEKWKKSQLEAVDLATKKEAERAKAAARIIELDRQVADQQRKNEAMFKIGSEVLNRYEKFVLGDAIAAREPFTGIARVRFQTLAQDFQDKLTDEKIKPSAAKVPEANATPVPTKVANPKATPAKSSAPKPKS